jgi:hypothetical protein
MDKGAAMWRLLHQAFFDKLLDGLTYRNAANAQPFRQVAFDQARAERKLACANGITQTVSYFIAECF